MKPSVRFLLFFSFSFLLLRCSLVQAQDNKPTTLVAVAESGIDAFPVYKSLSDDCSLDSVLYVGPFIILCVSFDKVSDGGIYRLEAPTANRSWVAQTVAGYEAPLLLRNVQKNGQLIAKTLKTEGLDITLEALPNRSKTRISCQFQFWRRNLQYGNIALIEPKHNTESRSSSAVTFRPQLKDIRLRKNHYTRPVNSALRAFYEDDLEWSHPAVLETSTLTVDDSPLRPQRSPYAVFEKVPEAVTYKNYQIVPSNQGRLFLESSWQTATTTVFRVRKYNNDFYSDLYLEHQKAARYVLKMDGETIPMQAIKNVHLNKALLIPAIPYKSTLTLSEIAYPYVLTYEIHFERLPALVAPFDLIEQTKRKNTIAFSFFGLGEVVE